MPAAAASAVTWAALFAAPSGAPADFARVHLEWSVPPDAEGCVDARSLGRAIDERLARSVIVDRASADLSVRGRVDRSVDGDWIATLDLLDGAGKVVGARQVQRPGESCAELDRPVAVVLALLCDVRRDQIPGATPPAPPPATGGPVWDGAVGAGGDAAVGLFPGLAGGVRAFASFAPPRRPRVEIAAVLHPAGTARREGFGADLWAWRVGVGLCRALAAGGALGLRACAGVAAGRLHAAGFGFPENHDAARAHVEALAGARAEWRLVRRLGLYFGLDLAVALVRPSVVFSSGDVEVLLYEMGAVGGAAIAGAYVPFR